jgi:hypothetical protein
MIRRHRNVSSGRNARGWRASRSTATPIYGIKNWDASTALATAVDAGVDGSALGMGLIMAFYVDALPTTISQLSARIGASAGHSLDFTATAFLRVQVGTGGAFVAAPTIQFTAGDVGKIHVVGVSADVANTGAFMYLNKAQVGLSTAMASYAVPVGDRHAIGSRSAGTLPALNITILGLCGKDSPLSLADFQAVCDATKAAKRLSLGAVTGMTHMWRAPAVAGAMPATLTDDIGAESMSFVVGAAANVDVVQVPDVWGF